MRLAIEIPLIRRGDVVESDGFIQALAEIRTAISRVTWPPDSDEFTIFPESGKKRGKGSGVRPIRDRF
ncbi:MAG: hypothetical protein P1T08_18970, partial [Acidimicrobiia bacterium]|nr:hypothetical protein [Acidimicrobiia bacterium]